MSQMREPTPGTLPAEGRDDLGLDGADRDPGDEGARRDVGADRGGETERRDRLADRVGSGMPSPAGGTESDLLTGTDVPEERM